MKKQFFETETDGFYATYYENPNGADHAVIGLFGDDPNDYMAKCGAKWLHRNGVNALCVSPGKKNYSHVNYPLERIESAIRWLKAHGNKKIGIMGMSTTAMVALAAASYLPELTLTVSFTGSDFVWQGFEQGKRDGCREWPVPNASTISWKKASRFLTCRSCTSIRPTGTKLRKKQKAPEISSGQHVCLSTLKK